MSISPDSRVSAPRWALLFMMLMATSCSVEGGAHRIAGSEGADGEGSGNPWFGLYDGSGQGTINGMSVMPGNVVLSIQPDADSVRIDTCENCFSVRLDTLFTKVNVPPGSLVSLQLEYSAMGVLRSLRLDRYSAGGNIGNVVNANLTLSGDVTGSIEYVLERR